VGLFTRLVLAVIPAVIILAVVLGLAFLPRVIPWEGHRAQVDALVAHALDTPFASEGQIALRILPTPRLAFERARIGNGAKADNIEARFSLSALLLHAETRIEDASLLSLKFSDEPETRIKPEAFLHTLIQRGSKTSSVTAPLGILRIGRLVLPGIFEEASPLILRNLVLSQPAGNKSSLSDTRWRVEGESEDSIPFAAELSQQPSFGEEQRLRLSVTSGGGSFPHASLEGRLSLVPQQPVQFNGRGRLSFGPPQQKALEGFPIPLVIEAAIEPFAQGWNFRNLTVKAGTGEALLNLEGAGVLDIQQRETVLDLHAPHLALETLFTSPELRFLSQAKLAQPFLPWPIRTQLRIDSLTLLEDNFEALTLTVTLDKQGVTINEASLKDDEAQISLTANAPWESGTSLSGKIAVHAKDFTSLRPLLFWSGLSDTLNERMERYPLSLTGDFSLTPLVGSLYNARLTLGDITLTGAARYLYPETSGSRGKLEAQIAASGLDIRQLPDIAALGFSGNGPDLVLALDARSVRFGEQPDDEKTSDGEQGTGRITARIAREGGAIALDPVELSGLAGAQARLSGRIEADGSGQITGQVTARKADPIFAIAGAFWSGKSLLERLPPVLREAPLEAELVAQGDPQGRGARFTLTGKAANSRIHGSFQRQDGAWKSLSLRADAPNLKAWFPQAPKDSVASGPVFMHLTGQSEIQQSKDKILLLNLSGEGGGLSLATTIPLRSNSALALLESGALRLSGQDLRPVFSAFTSAETFPEPLAGEVEIDFSRLGRIPGLALRGLVDREAFHAEFQFPPGNVPRAFLALDRLSAPWLFGFLTGLSSPLTPEKDTVTPWSPGSFVQKPRPFEALQMRVSAMQLDFGHEQHWRNALIDLALTPDGLRAERIAGEWGLAPISGSLTLRRNAASLALDGSLHLADIPVSTFTGPSPFTGFVSGQWDFAGSGDNPARIVASLSGNGELRLKEPIVAGLDPVALNRTLLRLLTDPNLRDPRRQERLLTEELRRQPFVAQETMLPLSLVGGVVRFEPITLSGKGGHWHGTAQLDLSNLTSTLRGKLETSLPIQQGTKPLQLGVLWRSPFLPSQAGQKFVRELDISSFNSTLYSLMGRKNEVRRERRQVSPILATQPLSILPQNPNPDRRAIPAGNPATTAATPEQRLIVPPLPAPVDITPAPQITETP
jgi:hypothetical protein